MTMDGSSPLARGTRVRDTTNYDDGRFIPACAGNSEKQKPSPDALPVHPRLRGELFSTQKAERFIHGSPPLARGTHSPSIGRAFVCRFIPAYAGNSCRGRSRPKASTVHPRLRGELRTQSLRSSWIAGSSPLTRGTPVWPRDRGSKRRFIPAYAGNSSLVNAIQ